MTDAGAPSPFLIILDSVCLQEHMSKLKFNFVEMKTKAGFLDKVGARCVSGLMQRVSFVSLVLWFVA